MRYRKIELIVKYLKNNDTIHTQRERQNKSLNKNLIELRYIHISPHALMI